MPKMAKELTDSEDVRYALANIYKHFQTLDKAHLFDAVLAESAANLEPIPEKLEDTNSTSARYVTKIPCKPGDEASSTSNVTVLAPGGYPDIQFHKRLRAVESDLASLKSEFIGMKQELTQRVNGLEMLVLDLQETIRSSNSNNNSNNVSNGSTSNSSGTAGASNSTASSIISNNIESSDNSGSGGAHVSNGGGVTSTTASTQTTNDAAAKAYTNVPYTNTNTAASARNGFNPAEHIYEDPVEFSADSVPRFHAPPPPQTPPSDDPPYQSIAQGLSLNSNLMAQLPPTQADTSHPAPAEYPLALSHPPTKPPRSSSLPVIPGQVLTLQQQQQLQIQHQQYLQQQQQHQQQQQRLPGQPHAHPTPPSSTPPALNPQAGTNPVTRSPSTPNPSGAPPSVKPRAKQRVTSSAVPGMLTEPVETLSPDPSNTDPHQAGTLLVRGVQSMRATGSPRTDSTENRDAAGIPTATQLAAAFEAISRDAALSEQAVVMRNSRTPRSTTAAQPTQPPAPTVRSSSSSALISQAASTRAPGGQPITPRRPASAVWTPSLTVAATYGPQPIQAPLRPHSTVITGAPPPSNTSAGVSAGSLPPGVVKPTTPTTTSQQPPPFIVGGRAGTIYAINFNIENMSRFKSATKTLPIHPPGLELHCCLKLHSKEKLSVNIIIAATPPTQKSSSSKQKNAQPHQQQHNILTTPQQLPHGTSSLPQSAGLPTAVAAQVSVIMTGKDVADDKLLHQIYTEDLCQSRWLLLNPKELFKPKGGKVALLVEVKVDEMRHSKC